MQTLRFTRATITLFLLTFFSLLAPIGPAVSYAWANGQNADLELGQHRFLSATGATSQNQLYHPEDIAIDPTTGKVFVSDSWNGRLLRFASLAAVQDGAPAEGVLGKPDFLEHNIYPLSQSNLVQPLGIVVDQEGRLWVAEGVRVIWFNNAASKPNGAPADGLLGQTSWTNAMSDLAQNRMVDAEDVAVETNGRLWVADGSRVLRFDNAASKPNGANADGVLGPSNFTTYGGVNLQSVISSKGVAVETNGRLWVADSSRVLRFDNAASKPNGANADGVLGQSNLTTTTGATAQDRIRLANDVEIDSDGRLWVADIANQRVLRFDDAATKPNGADADGVLGQLTFTSNTSATTQTGMNYPSRLAIDTAGRLWVGDYNNNRVLRFDHAASKPNGASADGVLGQSDFTGSIAATTQSGFNTPRSVAADPVSGKIFVADTSNNRVLRFASLSSLTNGANAEAVFGQQTFDTNTTAATEYGMNQPYGVTVDVSGRLWVADSANHRVLRFDEASTKLSGESADGVLGQLTFTSALTATTQNGMSMPTGLVADNSGRLWVADTHNQRVLRFDHASVKENGSNADGVLGQLDFTTRDLATTQSGVRYPTDVAIDRNGVLWVADVENCRVLRFDQAASKANGANADGVLGQSNYTSRVSATTQSGMVYPVAVAVDRRGQLWVADGLYSRILRFDGAATKLDGASADGVLGQPDFTSQLPNPRGQSYPLGTATSQNGLYFAMDVAVDGADNVWVADTYNNRVLMFAADPIVTITRADSSSTGDTAVTFVVNFSEAVTGVQASNFAVATTGSVAGTSITSVSGNGTSWSVVVATGTGAGTIRLDMLNTIGVQDLSGRNIENIPYSSGESYVIERTNLVLEQIASLDQDQQLTLTITVENQGPSAADGAIVTDMFPPYLTGVRWMCQATAGTTCGLSGTGNLIDTLTTFPSGGRATYTVLAQLSPSTVGWSNVVSVSAPGSLSDLDVSNNTQEIHFGPNPTVTITRVSSSPTNSATIAFLVAFSEPVIGVQASNFDVITTGSLSGTSITSVNGSGASWTVTITTGTGSGTIRLDMVNTIGVHNNASQSIGNIPFTTGQSYTIDRAEPEQPGLTYHAMLPLVMR